jgi:lysophospholipase
MRLVFFLLLSLVINNAMADLTNEIGCLALSNGVELRYKIAVPERGASRGSVLLLQGRAENIEKYSEQIGRLNQAGFSVFTFDWRGQGLSSRLLDDSHKGHVRNFSEYLEDIEEFDRKIWSKKAGDEKRYLIAHSLGGHVALRYLVEKKVEVDAALLVSPMFGINTSPWPRQVAELLAASAVLTGFEESYIPGSGPYIGRVYSKDNVLTNDARRFAILPEAIREDPALALGGPTFGWLNAAFDSVKRIHARGYGKKIEVPITVLVGEEDSVIHPLLVRQLCERIANCKQIDVKEAKHEIMMEKELIQRLLWVQIEETFR